MRSCLGIAPNTKSVVVRDNTAQEVMLRTLKAWVGHNFLNFCLNREIEESNSIYAKNKIMLIEWLFDRNKA